MPCVFVYRDVLPFTLKLPEAISSAETPTELEKVAKLGAGTVLASDQRYPKTAAVTQSLVLVPY